jgi:hypothetical protein
LRFKKEMSGHIYASLIDDSLNTGIDSGVEGKPTLFINGIRYEHSWHLKTFPETLKRHKYSKKEETQRIYSALCMITYFRLDR